MKRDIQKWKKFNNKISKCNTKFVIPYQLYKCNIGIHYNHIRDIKRREKRKISNNKSSQCATRVDDTYQLYKYNIGRDYHHIMNKDKERHIQVQYRYRLSSH